MTTPTDMQEKQLRQMKIQTAFIVGIFLVIAAVGIFTVLQFAAMRSAVDGLGQTVQSVDPGTLERAVHSFSDAADQFGKLDMEELNETVSSLRSAAEQLKGMDMEKLNEMLGTLESAASKLQSAVSAIAAIFGR